MARTLFLGSARRRSSTTAGIRGLDRARVLLGCLQPGQTSSIYSDALNRLADRLHYLNSSGDKAQDATRFWFDTRANLRREMEDRKRRFDDKTEVRGKIAEALKRMLEGNARSSTACTSSPRTATSRTMVRCGWSSLPPEQWYSREEARLAVEPRWSIVRNNGTKPRYRGNRLLFLAAGPRSRLSRLRDAARVALAWGSIVDDVKEGRLNIDLLQKKQAEKELQSARGSAPAGCARMLQVAALPGPGTHRPKPSRQSRRSR